MDQQILEFGGELEGVDLLPDGFVEFYQISDKGISAYLGVNDLLFPEYHRDNGVTKIDLSTLINSQKQK